MGPIHHDVPFSSVIHIISLLFAIILVISKLETAIWEQAYSMQKTGHLAHPPQGNSEHMQNEMFTSEVDSESAIVVSTLPRNAEQLQKTRT